jgi:alanine racemase
MLVRGELAPIVGRVCMDLVMLDLTDVPGAREGDEVVLIGEQGSARRSADDLARELDTINYEVVTNLQPRVPRVYRRGGAVVAVKTAAGYSRT